MSRRAPTLWLTCGALVLALATGCDKPKAPAAAAAPAPAAAAPVAAPTGPTDAGIKKEAALSRMRALDASLAAAKKEEKPLTIPERELPPAAIPADPKAPPPPTRIPAQDFSVAAFVVDGKAKKIVMAELVPVPTGSGTRPGATTELYFEDGKLFAARDAKGVYVIENESLALLLDPATLELARGVTPAEARTRTDAIVKLMREAVGLFRVK